MRFFEKHQRLLQKLSSFIFLSFRQSKLSGLPESFQSPNSSLRLVAGLGLQNLHFKTLGRREIHKEYNCFDRSFTRWLVVLKSWTGFWPSYECLLGDSIDKRPSSNLESAVIRGNFACQEDVDLNPLLFFLLFIQTQNYSTFSSFFKN